MMRSNNRSKNFFKLNLISKIYQIIIESNAEKGAKPSSAQPDFIYLENESSFSKSNSFGVNKGNLIVFI